VRELRERAWSIGRKVLISLLCLFGAVAAVNTFGRAVFHGGGLSFATRITLLAPGETRLSLPPLGVASAHTHPAPVRIELELRGLNPSLLRNLGTDPGAKERMLADLTARAHRATRVTALLALGLAGLGGLGVAAALRKFGAAALVGAFLLGSLFCGGLLGWTYLGYNLAALEQPKYEGMLESAPWVMSVLTGSLDGLQRLGQGFAVMARNLPRLSRQGETGAPMAEIGEDLRVLHVSDIHNNVAAYDLIGSLVANFGVDLVIDTGDLTDYGTPFESELAAGIGKLGVVYVFAPGNHDSPEVSARLGRIGNVRVVDGRTIIVRGLRILGLPDPSAAGEGTGQTLPEAAKALASLWNRATVKPDIVLAHNFELLAPLVGRAPVILHGHDHRASLRQLRGTLIEDAGTSGAAGLRGLASRQDIPYTVDLQYWRKDGMGRYTLAAIDAISIDGLKGTLHVERTVIRATQRQESGG